MGKIDESIMENYRKALADGNLSQAAKAVRLAKSLKYFIETDNFVDYEGPSDYPTHQTGTVFKPFTYKYYKDSGVVIFFRSTVNLTPTENKLVELLSQNETSHDSIQIIKTQDIIKFVWPEENVTTNAVRILIKRLRVKIEPNPYKPQILLNFNKKGYIFIAQREM